MEHDELGDLLEELHERYNTADFVADDPVSIPHLFTGRGDREIAGFLVSGIAWGNRKAIVKSGRRMVELMDMAPLDFTMNASEGELAALGEFVHRTFSGEDFVAFVRALRHFYRQHGGIGDYFEQNYEREGDLRPVMSSFRRDFFAAEHPARCEKHLSSIDKKAACKRLNMFIRWMVRDDGRGVDFGMWKRIPASALYLPLDVHSGNMARALGLLHRRQNDWPAVEEVTAALRTFDPADPAKYDFALFGAGIAGYLK